MRIQIDIDDALMTEAMEATGMSTKKAAVEEALRLMVENYKRRQALEKMTGLGWEGDLDEMRQGRDFGDWR